MLVLVLHVLLLLDMTLRWFPRQAPSRNLVPFRTIAYDLTVGGWDFYVNVLGNIVAFIPFGFLPPLISRRRLSWAGVGAAGALFSAAIVGSQFLLGTRVTDVDDVLLNATGTLIGFMVAARLRPGEPARAPS